MKKIYFLPFLSLLISCGSDVGFKQPDKRAETQLALIKEFVIADSTYQAQINDVTKKESFEKSTKRITDFVDNTLKNKIENWEAVLKSISNGIDGIDATFEIPKASDAEEPNYAEFYLITFESKNIKDEQLQKLLKTLQPNDKVLISGTFGAEKDTRGILQFQTLYNISIHDEDQLQSPSFNLILTGINKKPVEKL